MHTAYGAGVTQWGNLIGRMSMRESGSFAGNNRLRGQTRKMLNGVARKVIDRF